MHDVAWRGKWICVRSKDAQKQLARTSLSAKKISSHGHKTGFWYLLGVPFNTSDEQPRPFYTGVPRGTLYPSFVFHSFFSSTFYEFDRQ